MISPTWINVPSSPNNRISPIPTHHSIQNTNLHLQFLSSCVIIALQQTVYESGNGSILSIYFFPCLFFLPCFQFSFPKKKKM